jgi:superfamily II DNA or RNA helicase
MKQTLRPYQEEAVDKCRNAAFEHGRVLLQLPTGGGKTTIAAEIIRLSISKKKSVLFLVHRRELIHQAYERFTGFGMDCSVILSKDKRCDSEKNVQIGMVQTCVRRKKYMQSISPDLIIVDEAHHAVAKSYITLLKMYSQAYVMGLSATPYRSDGKGLGAIDGYPVFKSLVKVETTKSLIKNGYLSDCEIWSPGKLDFSKIGKRGGDYKKEEVEKMFLDGELVRELVDHWFDICQGDLFDVKKRTIVFASGVVHSKKIMEEFNRRGVPAAHIDGETKKSDRENIIADLTSGKITVVSNYGVLTEGFDCPAVSCVVLARPTKSASLYKQMVGRALRVYKDKLYATIIDYGKNVQEHFWPTEDPDADLSAGVTEETGKLLWRCKICETENKPGAKQCGGCGYVRGSWACPKCLYLNMENDTSCKKCETENFNLVSAKKEYEKRTLRKLKEADREKQKVQPALSSQEHYARRSKFFDLEDEDIAEKRSLWWSAYKYKSIYGSMPHDDGILSSGETYRYFKKLSLIHI